MAGSATTNHWVEQAVVYGVIPRNFGERGLRSVTERLADLHDLGVDALWLSPINRCPPGDFGYAVVDYLELRPDYGTRADFRELVQQAHARGMRVLMDVVPNHTSSQHPYFLQAAEHGPDSPYYDFYDRDEAGAPTHYFSWEHLPNLNYDNPEVRQWMTSVLEFWVREFDVDGFRVDVAWGIKERRPDFWPECCAALRRLKPDVLLLAEASARDPYYCTHGFDAAYDWTDELGHWAWEHVFEDQSRLVHRLRAALSNDGHGFHPATRIFRFLNNNDTGARFISRYGRGMTLTATALLLTLPGIPCLYTGDEVGAAFHPYQDPQPIDWQDHAGLRVYHQRLIALRRQLSSLHSPSWLPLQAEPAERVFSYLRYREEAREPVLVVLNFSTQQVDAIVELPERIQAQFGAAWLHDWLADEQLAVSEPAHIHISLAPWGARILTPREARQTS